MLNPEIEQYAELFTQKEQPLLQKLNRETHLKVLNPRMLAGHMQGTLLRMLSHMLRPKQILEIGTFTGYSTLCLADGLQDGGVIHTIDINQELEDMAKAYFKEAGIMPKVRQYVGNALNIIPEIDETFDLVFIDADKENYVKYYELVFAKVRIGGFIIADNALWNGKVLTTPDENDKETLGVMAFNKLVQTDKRVENMLLPFRDGLMIVRKLSV